MIRHDFDHLSFFCMGCGLALMDAVEKRTEDEPCPDNDPKAYLLARHRMSALVDPVLRELGFLPPETKQ
jgi:hypothetical protein